VAASRAFNRRGPQTDTAHGTPGRPVGPAAMREALLALKFDLGPFGADSKFGNDTAAAVRAFTQRALPLRRTPWM
jgi:hypothetical protein